MQESPVISETASAIILVVQTILSFPEDFVGAEVQPVSAIRINIKYLMNTNIGNNLDSSKFLLTTL